MTVKVEQLRQGVYAHGAFCRQARKPTDVEGEEPEYIKVARWLIHDEFKALWPMATDVKVNIYHEENTDLLHIYVTGKA